MAGLVLMTSAHTLWLGNIYAAERKLARAAERAVLEATLPRTSRAQVIQVAREVLSKEGVFLERDAVALAESGRPALQRLGTLPGQEFEVIITLETHQIMPGGLARFGGFFGMDRLQVRATRIR